MAEITVRPLGSVDDHVVAGLRRLLPQVSSTAPLVDAPALQSLLDGGSTFVFVAERNKEVVGTASLAVLSALSGRKGHVEDVAVDESARRAGIATLLMKALLSHARHLGLGQVDLTSRPGREAANALYRSLGFEQRETNVYRYDLDGRTQAAGP